MSIVTILAIGVAVLFAIYALKGVSPMDMAKKLLPPTTPPKKAGA